jgi:glycosyltransferase involved in cell wall biosynthesis
MVTPSNRKVATEVDPHQLSSYKRVILINRFFYPDHSPTSELLSDVAFMLASKGFYVTVLASRLRYDNPAAVLCPLEKVRGVEIRRIWTSSRGRHGLAGRALDYLTFYFGAGYWLSRLARRGNVIVAKTDPPLLSIIAACVARARRARLVNWLQDLFPEVAEAVGVGGRTGGVMFGQLRRFRNWSLRSAQMNVIPGAQMYQRLIEEGVPSGRLRVIPNWSDGSLIKPDPLGVDELRQKWGLNGCFVVEYAGNLGRAHDISTIIEAMARLQDMADAAVPADDGVKNVRFLFVGGGAQRQILQSEILKRQLRNVTLQPYQPREALSATLAVGNIHLVSLKPELEGLVVPSKFYGIAAAARPVLFVGAKDGEIARLVRGSQCGFAVSSGDADELVAHILEIAINPQLGRKMGERGRASFEQYWDQAHALQHWEQLLAELYPTANIV